MNMQQKYLFSIIIIALSLMLQACGPTAGGGIRPDSAQSRPSSSGPPRIISLNAEPPVFMSGIETTLRWETDNAVTAHITNIGAVHPNGSLSFVPTTNKYTLTAWNSEGDSTSYDIEYNMSVLRSTKAPPGFRPPVTPKIRIVDGTRRVVPLRPESISSPQHKLKPVTPVQPGASRVKPATSPTSRVTPAPRSSVKLVSGFTPKPHVKVLPAPQTVAPKSGAKLKVFPRKTKVTWQPVNGAVSYSVEVDCFHCCKSNMWCTSLGREYMLSNNIRRTSHVFTFGGKQPGRWRVWAIDETGKPGVKSQWQYFEFLK